jgi:hypothetical protein
MTALFIGANAKAQIDFESSLTDPETYNNGSEGPEGFDFSPIQLVNSFDGGYFSGFAISNVTDNTTPGYTNQYSAYPGAGADNSSTYAVAYSNPKFYTTQEEVRILSFDISNTTYAGLSMLNGDSFAKKFGEDTSAAGEIDGTNGEDFFRVWIIGENINEGSKDSIEFYLADYRFADNTEDYILDTWENIDLSTMAFAVNNVTMRFESSDMNDFGMATPAYVAIDNINWEAPVGISEVIEADYKIYPNPVNDILRIEGPAGILSIAAINGKEVIARSHNLQSNINFSALPAGVYILSINTPNGTVTKRIIK